MSKFQRFQNIVIGLSMLISAAILILLPEGGCLYIMLFLAASLILRGISELIYYFTMARYMVGGKLILFIGAVFFDFGIFTLSLSDESKLFVLAYLLGESKLFVLAYLLGFHAFAGLVNVLRALEAKRYKSTSWRLNMAQGVASILTVVICMIFSRNEILLVYCYCAGMIYSAALRIYSAFRRTAVVYIQ